jgi:hypothetical protein
MSRGGRGLGGFLARIRDILRRWFRRGGKRNSGGRGSGGDSDEDGDIYPLW